MTIITLGKNGTYPLNFSNWNVICLRRIGRIVKVGEKLSKSEWAKLGYPFAAGIAPTISMGDLVPVETE